jgi:hypothetical protein
VGGDTEESQVPTTFVGRASAPTAPSWERADADAYPPPQIVVVEVPRRRSVSRIIVTAVGIVAAFCAIGGTAFVVAQGLLQNRDAVASGPSAGQQLPPKPRGLNTPVRDGMFEFTVTRVSCGQDVVSAGIFSRTPQGQFCLVTLRVANIGREGRGFAEGFQKAIGADGDVYAPDSAAGLIVNAGGATVWTNLNPGNNFTATMVFDIARTATIAELQLHDSAFSNGVTVSLR